MFVKWAIIKLLITMHLAMPADILTKAVDLETHTKMRNLMMNISWVYKGNTAKMTRLVKAFNEHSRLWREVMNKEGDVPEAVGMLCQSDLRLRL